MPPVPPSRLLVLFELTIILISTQLLGMARADFASDRAECASQLMGLATCITYVQGGAKAPTPDCCSAMKQVVAKSFKCLCVLVKDRNEPELGIKFNATLALLLPSKCDSPANVTDCPRLLNLPPNSAEAKVFEQFGHDLEKNASGSGNSTGSSTEESTGSGEQQESHKNASLTASSGTESNKKGCLGSANMGCGVWALLCLLLIHVL